MRYVNINGKLLPGGEAALPLHSSAFRYGHGLFETMLVRDGVIQLAKLHWQRLEEGMKALGLSFPKHLAIQKLEEHVLQTVAKNNLQSLCRVRLQVHTVSDGLYDELDPAQYLIECYPLQESIIALNENGLVVSTYEDARKSPDAVSAYKTTNALVYALAAQTAKQAKWNDALILNTGGNIIETTIANIFWVKEGNIYTPPVTEGCVAGIMRQHLTTILSAKGYEITEQPLSKEILADADEVFLTNAIRGIKWVRQWENNTYSSAMVQKIASFL